MENNREPSLDDLAVFLAVCSTGGFRAAAIRLGMSPSNVSDIIGRVERLLGVPLLTRTTRSVAPTEAGQALAARLAPLLADTRAALRDVAGAGQQVQGLLKLNVTGAVMVDILPPLIDRFLATYPAVRVELVVEDRLVDAIADGCAAGIRYGEHLAQDMIAVPIGPRHQQLALAAAPVYLARRGHPAHPNDLLEHACVRLRFSSGALTQWEFARDGERLTVDPPARVVIGVDGAPAAIDLARAGHGIICTFRNWLDPHLASGDLAPVLQDWWPQFEGPQLYFPRRQMPATLRAFVDLVRAAHVG
ncbi:LysR family transcriptional regulator [Duganella sp. Leaf126]|uniref:LysR family transcriptional regulator n=1 Tax=Duganella sp. Leaf126 TaxID=1736266 RepID=UPI000700C24D|nr:LysR family transcriptional regulator [Duganella sp. Leaf126]KQQ33000.1 LysR family transcriptional regulator [Duganella sp. Leaf126]